MDVSQLYMAAMRASLAPIAGESADNLFIGQVELKEWSWDFHNKEVKARYEKIREDREEAYKKRVTGRYDQERRALQAKYKQEDVTRLQKLFDIEEAKQLDAERRGVAFDSTKRSEYRAKLDEALNRKLDAAEQIMEAADKKSMLDRRREAELADVEKRQNEELSPEDKNFTFKFSKRVDVATTQLLNVMKAGELMPKVVLTMHQASVNTPWSLVITVNRVRLLDYKLKVDTSDTMTDMLEDWECEFESFGYVYQNRPHAGIKSLTAGKETTVAARAATQGTVRVFTMTNTKFW